MRKLSPARCVSKARANIFLSPISREIKNLGVPLVFAFDKSVSLNHFLLFAWFSWEWRELNGRVKRSKQKFSSSQAKLVSVCFKQLESMDVDIINYLELLLWISRVGIASSFKWEEKVFFKKFLCLPLCILFGWLGWRERSHISSKAKDPHPLASSGLISFCGLLKDIFSISFPLALPFFFFFR